MAPKSHEREYVHQVLRNRGYAMDEMRGIASEEAPRRRRAFIVGGAGSDFRALATRKPTVIPRTEKSPRFDYSFAQGLI